MTETKKLKKGKFRDLLTTHQMCGIFNKDRRALEKLGIPRINLGPGDYRYDPQDVEKYIEAQREVTAKP